MIEGNTFTQDDDQWRLVCVLDQRSLCDDEEQRVEALGGNGFYFNNTSVDGGAELACDAGSRLGADQPGGRQGVEQHVDLHRQRRLRHQGEQLVHACDAEQHRSGLPDGDADRQRSDEHECEPQRALEHQRGAVHGHGPGAAYWGVVELQCQLRQLRRVRQHLHGPHVCGRRLPQLQLA